MAALPILLIINPKERRHSDSLRRGFLTMPMLGCWRIKKCMDGGSLLFVFLFHPSRGRWMAQRWIRLGEGIVWEDHCFHHTTQWWLTPTTCTISKKGCRTTTKVKGAAQFCKMKHALLHTNHVNTHHWICTCGSAGQWEMSQMKLSSSSAASSASVFSTVLSMFLRRQVAGGRRKWYPI